MTEEETELHLMVGNEEKEDVTVKQNIKCPKQLHIDKDMLTSKAIYFFNQAKLCMIPYMILFLTNVGLTPTQAGLVNGTRYGGYIIGPPFWGMIADKFKAHRRVMSIICVSAMITCTAQPLMTLFLGNDEVNQCPSVQINNTDSNITFNNKEIAMSTFNSIPLFYTMMFLCLLTTFFDGSTNSFVDAGVIQKVSLSKSKPDFGRQRLFGAIGYGCSTLLTSAVVEVFPNIKITCYSGVFIVYVLIMIGLLLISRKLFQSLTFESSNKTERKNKNLKGLLCSVLCNVDIIMILMTSFINGVIRAWYHVFLFVYLKEIKTSNVMMGIIEAAAAISGVCIYFFSTKIIELFGGSIQAICFTYFLWTIRFFTLRYLENGWEVLLLQSINGLCMSLCITAMTLYIKENTPSPVLASIYGIDKSLSNGLGSIVASATGGIIFEQYGIKSLFMTGSICSLVWGIVLMIYMIFKRV